MGGCPRARFWGCRQTGRVRRKRLEQIVVKRVEGRDRSSLGCGAQGWFDSRATQQRCETRAHDDTRTDRFVAVARTGNISAFLAAHVGLNSERHLTATYGGVWHVIAIRVILVMLARLHRRFTLALPPSDLALLLQLTLLTSQQPCGKTAALKGKGGVTPARTC